MYVSDDKGLEFFKKELDLKEADQGANLVLMAPYYKHSVYDSREMEGLRVVSDIQLYLDLYKYPVRGREQAEHLYAKGLEMLFSGIERRVKSALDSCRYIYIVKDRLDRAF